jgi:hypothetical protein
VVAYAAITRIDEGLALMETALAEAARADKDVVRTDEDVALAASSSR